MTNQLEELVREFYEYQKKCFVRTNVKFEKLKRGGYRGEMDILAFDPDPKNNNLIHIECSISAFSDEEVKTKAKKKFALNDEDYKRIINLPNDVKISRKFIVNNTDTLRQDLMPAGVEHQTTKQFLKEVYNSIDDDMMSNAIPENYPILRGIQMIKWVKEGS